MTIENIEQAYQILGEHMATKSGDIPWQKGRLEVSIVGTSLKKRFWFFWDDQKSQGNGNVSMAESMRASEAALFIRDDMLLNGSELIWGMTFHLSSDGKFSIDYSYERPDYVTEEQAKTFFEEQLAMLKSSK